MNSRSTSTREPKPRKAGDKSTTIINKHHKSPESTHSNRVKSSVTQGFYSGCVRSPTEKQSQVSSKLTYPSKTQKNSETVVKQSQNSSPSPKPKQSSSQEKVRQFDCNFQRLSSAILHLAAAEAPLGIRSLEALLTREIDNCLGPDVNNPKYSQDFIQATRCLLDSLLQQHEEGRLQPRLVTVLDNKRLPLLKAHSATTICYRDRYLKELVMNVLQSLSSRGSQGEDTSQATAEPILGAESRQRIRTIRDTARAEAGLVPETIQELERRLEELQQSLSRNLLVSERMARELEEVMSQSDVTAEYVLIPKPAAEALKGRCRGGECERDEERCSGLEHKSKCLNDTSPKSYSVEIVKDNTSDSKMKLEQSMTPHEVPPVKGCLVKNEELDPAEHIISRMKQITQEEMIRVQRKTKLNLNQDEEKCLSKSFEDTTIDPHEVSDDDDDDDDDDEISEEETRIFLEAFKADIIENRKAIENVTNSFILGTIEEDDELCDDEKINCFGSIENNNKSNEDNIEIRNDTDCVTSTIGLGNCPSQEDLSNLNPTPVCSAPTNLEYVTLEKDSNMSLPEMKDKAYEENKLHNLMSKCRRTEQIVANDIRKELNHAFERMNGMFSEIFDDLKLTLNNSIDVSDELKLTHDELKQNVLEYTVAEIAAILKHVSIKIFELPHIAKNCENFSGNQKEQIFSILRSLESSLGSSFPTSLDSYNTLENDELISLSIIKNVSNTFALLSQTLFNTSSQIQKQPVSVLSPPESLSNALSVLASTEYFRGCFISGVEEIQRKNVDVENQTEIDINAAQTLLNFEEEKIDVKEIQLNKPLEIVRPNIEERTFKADNHFGELLVEGRVRMINKYFARNIKNPNDMGKHLSNFEHYLGLTASVMTFQNVSDMFLLLSTVLNDIPDRIKAEPILNLQPPDTLLLALDILYSNDDDEEDSFNYVDKRTSFASLTVQNTADFFLTLSKTFQDAPPRVKNAIVLDLNPPRSLLKAINLLTSLPLNSVLESRSELDIEEKEDSQEKFFDAVDSLSALKCL